MSANSHPLVTYPSPNSILFFIDTTDWIIRKGAIRAYKGERMIIPFNMRDGILICEGRSNPDWNYSAPHGAGRVLARNQAFKTLDIDEFKKEMEGIYLFESFIRVDSSIEWSQDSSEPVVEFKKSSRSAKEYIALAEEVMNRVSR